MSHFSSFISLPLNIFFFFLFKGLLDSLTSTAEVKECPGICVHSFATIICYEVLEDVQCPSKMKCCVESNNTSQAAAQSQSQSTTQKPIRTTTLGPQTSKPTQKVDKPTKSETKEGSFKSN